MFKIIKSSQLKTRFDVRYHSSGEVELEESWTLDELSEKIVRDPNCYGFNYSIKGIPLVRISDMKQPFVDFSRVSRISKEVHSSFRKTHLEPYDILISVRGMSTGKVSIFLGEFSEANISPNIIIVRLKDVSLAPYVAMVLISDIGQKQIQRYFSGGGKPSLTAPMVKEISIPAPSVEELSQINSLFDTASKERAKTKTLLAEIDNIFGKGFDDFKIKKSITNLKKKSSLSDRWDPHYHNDGYVALREFINSKGSHVKMLVDLTPKKTEKIGKLDKKKKAEYLEIGSINNLTGLVYSQIVDYPEALPKGVKIEVNDGDLLISKVRPYLNTNIIFQKISNDSISIASKNAFSVFDSSQYYYKYYLAAFFRSIVGLAQVVMYESGTSYPTISDDDTERLKVISLPEEDMESINDLYKEYINIKSIEEYSIKAIIDILQGE